MAEGMMDLIEEDFTMRQLLKINILEERYSKWRNALSNLKQKERLLLLEKKKQRRRKWGPVLEQSHAYIRWMKCTKDTNIACVKNSAILLSSGYYIFVYDINSTKHQLYSATDVDGIKCLRGCREDDVFAFSERGNTPRIIIVSYPDLQRAFILRDRYVGKVTDLQFGKNGLLLALKCNYAEHRVVLWYWRYSCLVTSYVIDRPHKHPDYISTSWHDTCYAILQEHHDNMMLYVWDLYMICDNSLLAKKQIFDVTLEKYIYHDMQYDSNGILHLMDEKGNLYVFDSESKKVNLLIPWKPDYPPIDDIIENEKSVDIFLPQRRRKIIESDQKVKYVKEKYKEVRPHSTFKIKGYNKYKYGEVDCDKYEDESDTYSEDKIEERTYARNESENPCYFVWFKNGIVISGPNAKLKYYEKDADNGKWVKKWGFFPADPLKYIVTNQKQDRLYGWSERVGLKELRPMEISSNVLQFFGGSIRSVALLHPNDSFILTLSSMQTLCIWRKKSGRLMNILRLEIDMHEMTEHKGCELVVMYSKKEGSLYGFDLTNPRYPNAWPVLKVCREPFAQIKFLHNDWLITLSEHCVKVILIKANLLDGFEIISVYDFYYEVINFISVQSQDGKQHGIALFNKVPPGTQETPTGYRAGKMFEVINFPRFSHERLFNSQNFYTDIYTGPCLGHIIAIPGDMKFELHSYVMSEKDGNNLSLIARIKTDHQVGPFKVLIADQHYITYGFDGLIFVHDSSCLYEKEERTAAVLRNHHRCDGGVTQAVVDYKGQYVISLGVDGDFICSRIKNKYLCKHSLHVPKRMKQPLRTPLMKPVLKHIRDYEGEFWEDVVARKSNHMDQVVAECRLARIKKEFENIKKLWNEYYEQNQRENESERLSEESFELDKEKLPFIEKILAKTVKKQQEELTRKTKACLDWISEWKDLLWSQMEVQLYRIKPFEKRFYLENFNQCIKPHKYICFQHIMDALSQMDAAIFPVPDPKMLPWNKLNENNEYPECKLQKDPFSQDEEDAEYLEQEPEIEEEKLEEEEHMEDNAEGEEEEEVDEEVEDLDEEEKSSSAESCSVLGVKVRIPKVKLPMSKFFEEQMKEDDEELKTGVRQPLTNEEIIALANRMNKPVEMSEDQAEEKKEPLFTPEELADIAVWKEAELKKIKEGTLTPEQREAIILNQLDELFELYNKRCEEIKARQEKGETCESLSRVKKDVKKVLRGVEGQSEEQVEEEVTEEELIAGETLEGEGVDRDAMGVKEESSFVDVQHLEGKLFLESQAVEESKIAPEEDASDSTSYTWSDVGIEDLPPPEVKEETPESKPEKMEEEDLPPPSRPLPPPIVEVEVKVEVEPEPVDPLDEPCCMAGAQTSKFIPIDFVKLNEFTCNGMFTSDLQVSTLKRVIEDLEEEANKMFDKQLLKKADDLALINRKRSDILKNIDDLINVCKVEAPHPPIKYQWTRGEIPDWIFEYDPSPDEFVMRTEKSVSCSQEDEMCAIRERIKKIFHASEKEKEKEEVSKTASEENGEDATVQYISEGEKLFRYEALYRMMDGVLEMSWQELVMKGVKMPDFINEKDPGSYTEREQIALNNYRQEVKKLDETRLYHADLAKKNIKHLKQQIKDIVENYDSVLSHTLRKKLLIESCKQSELLKIARMKYKRLLAHKGFRHMEFLKKMENDLLDKSAQISIMLKYLQRKNILLMKESEKYEVLPYKIEKDFLKRIAPLGLPKKTTEHLKSLLKVKPAMTAELDKIISNNEYQAMAFYLKHDHRPIYLSEAFVKYFKALEELDSLKHCPHNVEPAVWDCFVHSRHATLSAEMSTKIYKSFIPEMEKFTYDYFKYFLIHLERIREIRDVADLEEDALLEHCNKMEFQLVLPDGLVETHQTGDIEDFKDCIYVSKKYIDTLNEDIINLEKVHSEKLKELDEKVNSVFDTETLHKELRLQIKIEENTLKDIKSLKFNKYVKDYLAETNVKLKEPYEIKDVDFVRGEKLKKLVRGYFKRYFEAVKKIERAKVEKMDIAKRNVNLEKGIKILKSETQKAKEKVDSVKLDDKEKPLLERNEAIMYHAQLSRQVKKNEEELEKLWDEYDKLQMKTYPFFKTTTNV